MKNKILAASLITIGLIANAQAEDGGRGIYFGAFGGAGRTDSQDVQQTGVAHKRGDYGIPGLQDFDLLVDVKGKAKRDTAGLVGAHVGYEWAATSFRVKPALELEAFYLGADHNADLANSNTEVVANTSATGGDLDDIHSAVEAHYGAGEHRFRNHMNLDMGVFMANGVFSYETGSILKPYVGAGMGVALLRMSGASSIQTSPASTDASCEITNTTGGCVNHFNSNNKSNDFAFAAQVKLGLRAEMDKHWSSFAEYRYLWVDSTEYTFGSTVYADHSPTNNWNYKSDSMGIHNALVGVEYAF